MTVGVEELDASTVVIGAVFVVGIVEAAAETPTAGAASEVPTVAVVAMFDVTS